MVVKLYAYKNIIIIIISHLYYPLTILYIVIIIIVIVNFNSYSIKEDTDMWYDDYNVNANVLCK